MNREEFISKLSEETKRKLATRKTPEEERCVLMDADELGSLDDEMVRKQYKRCIARGGYVSRDERQLPDWAKKIAKRYIKRTTGKSATTSLGCKRTAAADCESFYKGGIVACVVEEDASYGIRT